MVEVLGWPHNLYLFAFLQSNLVHFKDLGDKGISDLPTGVPLEKSSHISIDISQQRPPNRRFLLLKLLLLDHCLTRSFLLFLLNIDIEITHLPLQLFFNIHSLSEFMIAISKLITVSLVRLHLFVEFTLLTAKHTTDLLTYHHQRTESLVDCCLHLSQQRIRKRLRLLCLLSLKQILPHLICRHVEP